MGQKSVPWTNLQISTFTSSREQATDITTFNNLRSYGHTCPGEKSGFRARLLPLDGERTGFRMSSLRPVSPVSPHRQT